MDGTKYLVYTSGNVKLYVCVAVKEQHPGDNRSVLLLGMYLEGGSYSDSGGSYLGLGAYEGGSRQIQAFTAKKSGYLAENLEVTVCHAFDGTATQVPILWSWGCAGLGRPGGTLYVELKALDLVSRPTVSASFCSLGSVLTLSTNRVREDLTHTLTYTFAETGGTLAQQVGADYAWTVPESLADFMPNCQRDTCTITCATYAGSKKLGEKTCSVILEVGHVGAIQASEGWYTLTPQGGGAADGWGLYLADRSQVRVQVDQSKLTPGRGAEIRSIFAQTLNKKFSVPGCSGVFSGSGSKWLQLTVTDSRGTQYVKALSLPLLPYSPPTLTGASCVRCQADGTEDDGGNYLKVTGTPVFASLEGRNSAAMTLKIRTVSGSTLQTLRVQSGGVYGGSLSAQLSYRAVLEVTDAIGEKSSLTFTIPSQTVAFQLREGGDGASFGGPAQEADCLTVYWNNLKVGGSTVADFPVEVGSDNTWTWRKWRSGLAECWGTITGVSDLPTAWGGVYATGVRLYAQYPFTFAAVPHVQVTPVYNGSRNYWLCTCDSGGSVTQTPSYQLIRGDAYTIKYRLDFYCTGRWK